MAEDVPTLCPQDGMRDDKPEDKPESQCAQSPSTPVRGRIPRYSAELSKGRVPLHRRGTSRTLETLEDLLREHGYKETRIFTPERTEDLGQRDADERRRQSTWRIRDFLSGLLPRTDAGPPESSREDENTPMPVRSHFVATSSVDHSTPNSPLSHKRRLQEHSASSTTLSSLESIMMGGRAVSYDQSRVPAVRVETSSASVRTYAQVSAARGYLRHMASTPAMAKARLPSRYDTASLKPLPESWLGSVTKAVLMSGENAYIGGPNSCPSTRQSDRSLRGSKSTKSFVDRTNVLSPPVRNGKVSGLPPGATFYLRPQTAAPGTVNVAHVVCRSAPGSRSSSRVGDRRGGGGSPRMASRKQRQGRGRRGSRTKPDDGVPSLAATCVENDPLSSMHWVDGKRVPVVRMDVDDAYEEAIDSDSDDEELDLARLLVPPKRQHSIQSLRKHLHFTHIHTHAHLSPPDAWEYDEDVPAREHGRHVDIDEVDGYPTFDREEHSKRRRALPGAWGNSGRP